MRKYYVAAIMLIVSLRAPGAQPGVASLGQVIAGERSSTLAAPAGSVVGKLLVCFLRVHSEILDSLSGSNSS